MSSEAQIAANRQNAQKSTGPKTEQGKAASAGNSLKHGLLARRDVIDSEMIAEYEAHRDALLRQLKPKGAMEKFFARRVVSLTWRIQRAERMQNEACDYMTGHFWPDPQIELLRTMLPKGGYMSQDDPALRLGKEVVKDFCNERVLDRLNLYERRLENSLFKTLEQLQRLQLLRQLDPETQTPAAELAAALRAKSPASKTKPNRTKGQSHKGPEGQSREEASGSREQASGHRVAADAKQTQFPAAAPSKENVSRVDNLPSEGGTPSTQTEPGCETNPNSRSGTGASDAAGAELPGPTDTTGAKP
jgi:hypothetical protein